MITAQEATCTAILDNLWKSIKQSSSVVEKYSEEFRENYAAIMEGRYGEDGLSSMINLIKEDNPDMDPEIFRRLQSSIMSSRAELLAAQTKLIMFHKHYNDLKRSFLGSIMLANTAVHPEPKAVTLVSSTRTKNAVESGVDDDVSVFGE